MTIAPVFVSHGAPNLILHASPTRTFLTELGASQPKPKAIIAVSAHFDADRPVVVSDPAPAMIYDFGGFERELYSMQYPAPGEPKLAERVAMAIAAGGLPVAVAPKRGYDHGTWVPLKLAYPEADIPVVQVSVVPGATPAFHTAIGAALAPFAAEDVLILASGSLTHNLRAVFGPRGLAPRDAEVVPWARAFADWVVERLEAGDVAALEDYEQAAPFGTRNHPTDEHFLPFFVALGAGGGKGTRIHAAFEHGALSLDAYRFAA
ncbi:MAG: dioxygenase [Hyphomicrobiaceae bacterium]|nr:dioxygenase [Hyphomicrobiaceae bacterium]